MQIVEFELTSVCPLKMDRWLDGPQPRSDNGYRKQAEKKCHRDTKGNIAIPAVAIKSAMRLAASEIGKRTDAKRNRRTIRAQVFLDPPMLSIGKREHDGIVGDVVTRGRGEKVTRVVCYRPIINSWKVKGKMNLFGVPMDFIKECLELAGFRFGLLSHRPDFGRFIVTKFEEVK